MKSGIIFETNFEPKLAKHALFWINFWTFLALEIALVIKTSMYEKRKFADELKRIYILRESFFPDSNLQERIENFTSFYLELGDDFFDLLLNSFEPINHKFTFIEV